MIAYRKRFKRRSKMIDMSKVYQGESIYPKYLDTPNYMLKRNSLHNHSGK